MCLKTVNAKKNYGYKVGYIEQGIFNAFDKGTPVDSWEICTNNILNTENIYNERKKDKFSYHAGFHIFKTLKDARKFLKELHDRYDYADDWKIYKCEYAGIFAEGIDNNEPYLECVVAAKIFINSKEIV